MTGPRRSKRLQARNQPETDSRKITKAKTQKTRQKTPSKKTPTRDEGDMEEPSTTNDEGTMFQHLYTEEELEVRFKQFQAENQKRVDEEFKQAQAGRAVLHEDLGIRDYDYFVDEFWNSAIAGTILAFANHECFWDVPWDSLDETTQQKFLGWAPNAKELFELYGISPLMFRRWVWEIIDENFFSNKSKDIVWTSPFWEAQASLERCLRERDFAFRNHVESYKYPNWRYTTMQLYYSTEDYSMEDRLGNYWRMEPSCVLSILAKALGRHFPTKFEEGSTYNLKHLSEGVASMEFLSSCTLCSYSHVFHHPTTLEKYGFPFNPDVAEFEGKAMMAIDSTAMDAGRPIDLVAQPMLVKRGNREGYGYHVQRIVYPMQVCVNWLAGYEKMGDEEKAEEKNVDR